MGLSFLTPVEGFREPAIPASWTSRYASNGRGSCPIWDSQVGHSSPEALRALLARYFGRMKGIIERHGGTVEKFIGDAVMAVFGVPQLHEDDALRAVRAASEMQAALPELGLQARIGVNSGEVVTGTTERLATGDAVNVAARLEQAATPGEVLLGEETLRLVAAAVEVEAVPALDLKGKRETVPAHRLLGLKDAAERRLATPILGRSLCALGRYDEAEPWVQLGRDLGIEPDLTTQLLWRQVQALVVSHRGQHAEAERLEAGGRSVPLP